MAFTKIAAAGIGSTETVTIDGLSVINDGSFGGNVSIAGTLTYEDVTNVDSVGLITARAGVNVGSGITLSKDGDGYYTGVVTATSYKGDGSALTGIDATQILTGNTSVQTVDTGSDGHVKITTEGTERGRFDATGLFTMNGKASLGKTATGVPFAIGDSGTSGHKVLHFKRAAATNDINIQAINSGSGATSLLLNSEGGNVLTGHTAVYGSGLAQIFHTTQYCLDLSTWSADANGPTIDFYKSRNATKGSATIVQSGDVVGRLRFLGNDGANARTTAQITAESDGTPGTNDMPGRLVFGTTADGASSASERLRIDSSGRVIVGGTTHAGGAQFVVMGGSINSYGCIAIGNKTAAPTTNTTFAMFRLSAGSAGTSRGAEIAAVADANWSAGSSYPSRLTFSTTPASATAAEERMRITNVGDVIIGRTSTNTSHTLCVQADGGAEAIAVIGRSADDIGELAWFENDSSTRLGEVQYRQDHVNIRHRVGDIRFATGGTTERLRIATGGQLCLGTTNTTCTFTMSSGSNANAVSIRNTTAGNGHVGILFSTQDHSGGREKAAIFHKETHGEAHYKGDFVFCLNTASGGATQVSLSDEQMRLASNGQLSLKGDTDTYLDRNTTNTWQIKTNGTLCTEFSANQRVRMPQVYSTNGSSMRDVQVESDGTLCAGNTSIRASKINIKPQTDVSWLYDLVPSTFNYRKKIVDKENGNHTYLDEAQTETAYGLIAEEVETVNQDFCFYNDGELAGVSYSQLITPLLKALQDQKKEIDTLKSEVAALKSS